MPIGLKDIDAHAHICVLCNDNIAIRQNWLDSFFVKL